jgi:hypothetical protein
MSSAFVPRLGLTLVKLSHHKSTRLVQAAVVWVFAIAAAKSSPGLCSWVALALAVFFSFLAANLYPARIFIPLDTPERAREGLADNAPVLAVQVNGETVAYPLEILIPHHIVNDILGGTPILTAW